MKWFNCFFFLLIMPLAYADDCSLMNLAGCIPQKLYEFVINVINAPLQPLLSLIKSLLTEPVNTSLFSSLWGVMVYITSLFYGLLMLYSGFNFMISGYDAVKRANAKETFKNIFVMIVLIQASYFLYSLVIEIGSLLTTAVINLANPNFFLLTLDNLTNIGLTLFFGIFYLIALLIAVIFLTIRYIIVAAGVIFIPAAIFCYFIPPLQDYGKLIMNFLGVCIFLTFFDSVIFLVCSKMIEIVLFANFKILIMIAAFGIADLVMIYFMLFSAIKSATNAAKKGIGVVKTVTAVAKYLA